METKKQREQPRTHTPGPWHVLPDPVWKDKHPLHEARYIATSVEVECSRMGWGFVDDRSSIICTMPDAENQKQNARLIACAPELLDACKWALPLVLQWFNEKPHCQDHSGLTALREAIAKAEGRA